MTNIFAELQRRNVFRVAAMYIVVCWVSMQVIAVMTPALNLPDWVDSFLALLFIAGFPISMLVAWAFEITPTGIARTETVDLEHSIREATARKLDIALLAGLALVAGLIIFDRFVPETQRTVVAEIPGVETPALEASNMPTRIAVLPFSDISRNQDQQYFSDGISEEILNLLIRVKDLQVIGRTSSFSFRARDKDVKQIGEQLQASHILDGSVRKDDDAVRISVSLTETATGLQKWGETYNGTLENIFELQENIARAIADELKIVLDVSAIGELGGTLTGNTKSYDLFLQGRNLFRTNFSGEDMTRSIELMEQAVELDADFAEAWAMLGQAYLSAPAYDSSFDRNTFYEKAKDVSEKAIGLDPSLAYPYSTLASIKSIEGDQIGALDLLSTAQSLNPDDSFVLTNIGMVNAVVGRMDVAEDYFQRSLNLDPTRPSFVSYLAQAKRINGKLDESDQLARRAAEMGFFVSWDTLAWNAYSRGDVDQAITYFLKLHSEGAGQLAADIQARSLWESSARAYFQDSEQDRAAIRAMLSVYVLSDDADINGTLVSSIMRLEMIDLFFDNVDKALSGNTYSKILLWEDSYPADAARQHERFLQYAQDSGMVAFWEKYGWPEKCERLGKNVTTGEIDFRCR